MFLSETLFKRGVQVACSQCRFYRSRSANPGVGRRLKIFKQDDPDLSRTKLTEKEFDDSEVDIMDSALVEEYKREHQKISKRIAFQRVEREYFDKSTSPNFLLWSEKEQIRQLHHSEPERWTFEVLSQSFPATPEVIKKIVKAQWKLKDPLAVRKHDDKVIANWKALVKKKLELPPQIAEHLSKFTARERLFPPKESKDLMMLQDQQPSTPDKLVPTKSTQFINIVRKQQKSDSMDKDDSKNVFTGDEAAFMPSHPSETYVIGGRVPKRLQRDQYTLSEMKESGLSKNTAESVTSTPETADEISSDPTANSASSSDPTANTASKKSKGIMNPTNIDSFSIPRYADAGSSVTAPNDEPLKDIPMRITIPKEKWKKGAVYKVSNCFYADDGEFLYKI